METSHVIVHQHEVTYTINVRDVVLIGAALAIVASLLLIVWLRRRRRTQA